MKYAVFLCLISIGFLTSCQQEKKAPRSENAPEQPVMPGDDDSPVVEEHKETYDNGNLRIKGKKVNGKREGLWVSYYQNGNKWSETTFEAGVKSGPTTTYYEDGMMRYTGQYENDLKTGTWKFYTEDGKLDQTLDLSTEVAAPAQSDSL